jgi:hypothetical protein
MQGHNLITALGDGQMQEAVKDESATCADRLDVAQAVAGECRIVAA